MTYQVSRRQLLKAVAATVPVTILPRNSILHGVIQACGSQQQLYDISLAEWSLHRTLNAGELDNLDFPATAQRDYGIRAVEYVNQFFKDKAEDQAYLTDLKTRADDHGVRNVLRLSRITIAGWRRPSSWAVIRFE
jgi:hypothetical protein